MRSAGRCRHLWQNNKTPRAEPSAYDWLYGLNWLLTAVSFSQSKRSVRIATLAVCWTTCSTHCEAFTWIPWIHETVTWTFEPLWLPRVEHPDMALRIDFVIRGYCVSFSPACLHAAGTLMNLWGSELNPTTVAFCGQLYGSIPQIARSSKGVGDSPHWWGG
jgi:hypothetical protein